MKKKWIIISISVLVVAAVVAALLLTKKSAASKTKTSAVTAGIPADAPAKTDENATKPTASIYSKVVETLDLSNQHNPDVDQIMELKQLKELNLRGTHISNADYAKIREALPNCKILWSVLVGTVYHDDDSEEISVLKFTQEDLDALKYLPNLKKVDAMNITDEASYANLKEALLTYPDVKVNYKVPLGMADIQSDVNKVSLKTVNVEQLRTVLTYLPKLTVVEFKGELPPAEELQKLIADFPNVDFNY